MKWFVVIYPQADALRACLDALIFLANPLEKDAAHVTIRGPTASPFDASTISERVNGEKISVVGVDRFFEGRQNTVFLRCGGPVIEKFWSKPEVPYNPHLTIYDGSSRSLAEKIFEMLRATRPFFQITCGECQTVGSLSGQKSLKLWLELDKQRLTSVMGVPFDIETIAAMPDYRRLMFMERICPQLKDVARTEPQMPATSAKVTNLSA